MSNSGLVSYTQLSPNYSDGRVDVRAVVVHYVCGACSIETLGDIFAPSSRQASSNYGVGLDGRIGMYCEECNRSWCSSSSWADNRAITIECANYGDGSLSTAGWNSLVALIVDICRRNGIDNFEYTGDTDGQLWAHRWFGNTDCPGEWLYSRFGRLANEVNAVLHGGAAPDVHPANNTNGGKLVVDGIGGYNTVLDLQSALGAPYLDGVISRQYQPNYVHFRGITSVEFGGGLGSQTVEKLQERIGAGVDGVWGRETSTKLQEHLVARGFNIGPCGVDGYAGSDTIRGLQECLNAHKL